MDKNKNFGTPYMQICLCKRCASVYYFDKNYYIEKAELYQPILEKCDICRQFLGMDYNIWKMSSVQIEKSHNCKEEYK